MEHKHTCVRQLQPIPEGPVRVDEVMSASWTHFARAPGCRIQPRPTRLDVFAVGAAHPAEEIE